MRQLGVRSLSVNCSFCYHAGGFGGAMLEDLRYDADGQFLTGSLADYLLPTASDIPNLRAVVTELFPSPINALGAKGASEGGIISASGIDACDVGASKRV